MWCSIALAVVIGASAGEPPNPGAQSIYFNHIVNPASRTAREAACDAIRDKSVPVDRSSESSTEKSTQASMELFTEKADCRYMNALYTELNFASLHHVLGEGAWKSCLEFAPVHQLKLAVELAIYTQCLHAIESSDECKPVRMDTIRYSASGAQAACTQLLRMRDWAQWGLSGGDVSERTASLFVDSPLPPRTAPSSAPIADLPARRVLVGRIRVGFFFNCCTFGMGYMIPFSYLHLEHAITLSDDQAGTVAVGDVQLDQAATAAIINKAVKVPCTLDSGITGHYALSTYCHELGPVQNLTP